MAYLCIKNLMAIFAINFLILLRQSDIFFFIGTFVCDVTNICC